jgi:type I restriction enzyme, S subunit
MTGKWPRLTLGDVLKRSDDTIVPDADAQYREITVRLWGKGVVLRGVVFGARLAGQRRYVARSGQFILSRIDARHSALGMVPPELDGALVSNDFPVFRIAEDKLYPAYLAWLCKTAPFVEECRRVSEGTTNRVRLQEQKFLGRRFRCCLMESKCGSLVASTNCQRKSGKRRRFAEALLKRRRHSRGQPLRRFMDG